MKKIILVIVVVLVILSFIIVINKYFKVYKYIPKNDIENVIMDDNDLKFSIKYTDNKFNKIINSDSFNIKITDLKIMYDDLSETIYEVNEVIYDKNNMSVDIDNSKILLNIHIRKNNLKQVKKLNLYIGKIEIYTNKERIIFSKEQNISINIPEDSYNRNLKLYKAKYANDESVDLESISLVVNKNHSTAEIDFINSSIKETNDKTISIEDNLAIKNNSYIRDDKLNKYYQLNSNDSNNGYQLSKEGYLLKCWRTFKLPIDKATNILTIHLISKKNNIVITLED